jgi:hypothetical protein
MVLGCTVHGCTSFALRIASMDLAAPFAKAAADHADHAAHTATAAQHRAGAEGDHAAAAASRIAPCVR